MKTSQTQRILEFLSDGESHSVAEIHQACGYSRLNSRVADLRKRGHVIVCRSIPGKTGSNGYAYQLIAAPEAAVPAEASSFPLPSATNAGSGAALDPAPLRLFEAA